jgi:protein-S-isoprenylcysteine O-methyltransferase Ste14
VSRELRELVVRMVASTVFLGLAVQRAFAHKPEHWIAITIAETGMLLLIVLSYVRRAPAFEHARTWAEVVLPVVAAPLPVFLIQADPAPVIDVTTCAAIILAGDVVALAGYAWLGSSFSILVEARPLVARGPYRLVRHPIYLGQLIATAGVLLLRFSSVNAGAWALFVALQVARAVLEERKMLRATPGYAEYRARTWAFLPPLY